MRGELVEERLTQSIIGAFYEVYNTLGTGLLEQHYAAALAHELAARGHSVAREVSIDVWYKQHLLGRQRIDLIVDGKVVVETKATQELHLSATKQCFSYLRVSGAGIGLVLNFGEKPGVKRLTSRRRVLAP